MQLVIPNLGGLNTNASLRVKILDLNKIIRHCDFVSNKSQLFKGLTTSTVGIYVKYGSLRMVRKYSSWKEFGRNRTKLELFCELWLSYGNFCKGDGNG